MRRVLRWLSLTGTAALLALGFAGCAQGQLFGLTFGPSPAPVVHAAPARAKHAAKPRPKPRRKPAHRRHAEPAGPVAGPALATSPAAQAAISPAPSAGRLGGLPAGALLYGPLLVEKQRALWPDVPSPWTIAGLIEQESCASLKSAKCWNPRAELKTYREYGFGLGQITIAYRADHSERFNEFTELTRQYKSLHAWQFADRYNPAYQLTAVLEMTRNLWNRVPPSAGDEDRWAFTDSSYNGGLGSLLQDRRLCANSAGCDPKRWFGHIETHSLKSKAPQKAYGGQSWYSINRGHVRNVLKVRRAKYEPLWGS